MERVHLNSRGSNSVGRGSLRLKSGAFYFPLQELEGVVACHGKVRGLNVHIMSHIMDISNAGYIVAYRRLQQQLCYQ